MGRFFISSGFLLAATAVMMAAGAGTLPPELTAQHNPGKRSELAIELAAKALEQARGYYKSALKIVPDVRTNSLLVSGTAEQQAEVEALVRQIDQDKPAE